MILKLNSSYHNVYILQEEERENGINNRLLNRDFEN